MVLRIKYPIILLGICLLLPLMSSAADFKATETPHFAFFFHARDRRIMRSLIDEAEVVRREVVKDLGTDFSGITRVYLAPSAREYREMQPDRWVPSWSAGVAYPRSNVIILKSPRAIRGGRMDLNRVFKHELTHIAVGRAFRGTERVPRWLDEGLAMYESREWDLSRISTITRAVLTDSLIPLAEITIGFPEDAGRAELAYAQSFYLVTFLVSKYGRENFHRFIRKYSTGKSLEDVLLVVYGLRWNEFEERWRDYLKLRFSWFPIITSTTTLWFLISMVFIIGYVRKRRAGKRLLEEWEREEGDL
jgi:hypothetical protein